MDVVSVRRFGFDGTVIILRCEDKDILRFADSYLGPFFPTGHANFATWSVEISAEESSWVAARDAHRDACQHRPITMRTTPYTCWCESKEGIWSVSQSDPDTNGPTFYWTIDMARRESTLSVLPKHVESRYMVARLVRSILMFEALGRGWIQLHASCFAVDDTGVLILGSKRAGKTTFLLEAIRGLGADYISNDRTLVYFQNARSRVCGLPHSVAVRRDLLTKYDLEAHSIYYFQTDLEAKVRFLCTDICEKFGCRVVTGIDIRAIVFPQYRASAPSFRILSEDETRRRLKGFWLSKLCEFQPFWDRFSRPQEPSWPKALPVAYQVDFTENGVRQFLRHVVYENG